MKRRFLRLYLVRHGEVNANIEFRFLGSRDDPLNETGERQAEQLASLFSRLPVGAVFSSPLSRALATARAIGGAAGVEPVIDTQLRELDFGRWEGLTRDQILELGPGEGDILARWDRDPSIAAPDGESLVDLEHRIVGFADGLLGNPPEGPVVVVSHMGPIKILLCAALGLSPDGARRIFLDPATISVVDWSSKPVVRLVNSHSHLGWTNARWLKPPPARRNRRDAGNAGKPQAE
jgi:probable phosphoglycerate mutase